MFGLLVLALLLSTRFVVAVKNFKSIHSLDQNRQAHQVANAIAATEKRGQLHIVCLVLPDSMYVLKPSVTDKSARVDTSTVILEQYGSPAVFEAFLMTGVRADARWVLNQARSHSKASRVHYDCFPDDTRGAVSTVIRRVFWGNPETSSREDCRYSIFADLGTWGRPVGVKTLFIRKQLEQAFHDQKWELSVIDSTGSIVGKPSDYFACIGPGSIEASKELNQLYGDGIMPTEDELKNRVLSVVSRLVPEANHLDVVIVKSNGQRKSDKWKIM